MSIALPPFPVPPAVFRAGLAFRQRVLDFADLPLPAEGALWDYAAGAQRTRLAGALVTTGLADALGTDARDPVAVALELGLDPDVTARVLTAAAASRLARVDREGRVRLSRLGAPLRMDHPHSIAAWVAYQAAPTTIRAYDELGQQLRAGAVPSGHHRAFGDSVWEYFRQHPEEGARFGEAMRQLTAIDATAIAWAYRWPRRGVICDVAGGIGTLLAAILRRRPRARGILLDAPEVLEGAHTFLSSCGLDQRVERRAGDLFRELDVRADVYVLKWILHDWSDEHCREILTRVRATMPPHARIVTIDQRREPGRPSPITALVDLHMLVECEGGRERTPEEVHALMRQVGLEPGTVKHAGLHMLVEGRA